MTAITDDVQKQEVDSAVIELYDLAYTTDSSGTVSYARFFPSGLDSDLTEVQFRDSSGTARTYEALPMQLDGINISSDGAYNRPELTVANIESVFSDAIGGMKYENLIGKRLTRRTTLEKYLVGNAGDSGVGNAPVEFPKVTFVIDRIKSRNVTSVTFELAAPFDLAGIQLPRRVVVGGSCPFKYTGAGSVVYDNDNLIYTTAKERNKEGGCTWRRDGKFWSDGTAYYLYMNAQDDYIVPEENETGGVTFTNASGLSSFTANTYYYNTVSVTRINADGTFTDATINQYWQAIRATSSAPSSSSNAWRSVRIWRTYSASTTYYGYKDKRHNEYVLKDEKLWQVKRTTQTGSSHQSVTEGDYWTAGDVCGKTLTSCAMRFQAKPLSAGWSFLKDSRKGLPYGGFPGIVQRR